MLSAAVVACSMLVVLGLGLIVSPPHPHPPFRLGRQSRRLIPPAVATGCVVFLVSGWPLAAGAVSAATLWVGRGWHARQRTSEHEARKLEALASWVENVRDVLMAGEQPVGAITSTVSACAPVLRPPVRRLAVGLGRQDPEFVFRRFADDVDDPVGDLVATGLSIAVRRGARTVPVLSALAEHTRHEVDRRRLIEAERAPARREVQALTFIMGGLVIALLVLGRSRYLDAYDRPSGQLFLAVGLGAYAALIVRVQRLAAFPRPGRFLVGQRATMGGER